MSRTYSMHGEWYIFNGIFHGMMIGHDWMISLFQHASLSRSPGGLPVRCTSICALYFADQEQNKVKSYHLSCTHTSIRMQCPRAGGAPVQMLLLKQSQELLLTRQLYGVSFWGSFWVSVFLTSDRQSDTQSFGINIKHEAIMCKKTSSILLPLKTTWPINRIIPVLLLPSFCWHVSHSQLCPQLVARSSSPPLGSVLLASPARKRQMLQLNGG